MMLRSTSSVDCCLKLAHVSAFIMMFAFWSQQATSISHSFMSILSVVFYSMPKKKNFYLTCEIHYITFPRAANSFLSRLDREGPPCFQAPPLAIATRAPSRSPSWSTSIGAFLCAPLYLLMLDTTL